MIFSHKTHIAVDTSEHREVAAYLHQEISQLVDATPELNSKPFGPEGWRLYDASWGHEAEGSTPQELFNEFAQHEITPAHLSAMHMAYYPAGTLDRYTLNCHYGLGTDVRLAVEGPNRTIVDGIGARLNRMKNRLETGPISNLTNPAAPAIPNASAITVLPTASPGVAPSPQSNEGQSWLSRTWRDHAAAVIGAVVAGVVVLALGAWLRLN